MPMERAIMNQDDNAVRIPTSGLAAASAVHVSTTVSKLSKLFGELNGRTEWIGVCGCARFDIGWEWAVVSDLVVVWRPNNLRTNVELLDARGLTQSAMQTKVCLLEWIEKLPWREQVKAHALNS
jgi:hypothetical protein